MDEDLWPGERIDRLLAAAGRARTGSMSPDAPPDAMLAAYRAGELDPAEAEALERRLASDHRLRARLAWVAHPLDEGPMAERLRRLTRAGDRRGFLVAALLAVALGVGVSRGPCRRAPPPAVAP